MRFHGGKQQVLVAGPLLVPLVVGDDLVLRFLQLHQLAKLVGLARLPFAYDFRVRFKQTDQFVWKLGQASEHSCFGLPHHPPHLIGHSFQLLAQSAHTPTTGCWQGFDCNTRRESLRICRVNRSSCPYSRGRFSSPSVPLCRKASPMAITFLVTLRIRLRTFRLSPPTFWSIFFMIRLSTRAPSFSNPLSFGC